jgi:membrane protease YdiL (CAAX protease family)
MTHERWIAGILKIISITFFFLIAPLFLRSYLVSFFKDSIDGYLISRVLIAIPYVYFLFKYLKNINFQPKTKFTFLDIVFLISISLFFIDLIFINSKFYLGIKQYQSLIYFIDIFMSASIEELFFRGIYIYIFLFLFRLNNTFSIFISSVLFSTLHFFNLTNNHCFDQISGQVLFAYIIGVFLGFLMIRYENILIPILMHFQINLAFGSQLHLNRPIQICSYPSINDFSFFILYYSILILISIFILKLIFNKNNNNLAKFN